MKIKVLKTVTYNFNDGRLRPLILSVNINNGIFEVEDKVAKYLIDKKYAEKNTFLKKKNKVSASDVVK